jgi:hypothetical protein
MFAFLSTEDKVIYTPVFDSICQNLSVQGKNQLVEIFAGLKKTQQTEAGQNSIKTCRQDIYSQEVD